MKQVKLQAFEVQLQRATTVGQIKSMFDAERERIKTEAVATARTVALTPILVRLSQQEASALAKLKINQEDS